MRPMFSKDEVVLLVFLTVSYLAGFGAWLFG